MAAKVIRHPRTGKPLRPKQKAPTAGRAQRQRGRDNHRGYPQGQGPGGYGGSFAGAEGEGGNETVVVCESGDGKKKKFPWGTILLTGVVSTVGVIAAYKIYDKLSGEKRQTNPEPEGSRRALLDARDYLLMAAPGAENAMSRIPQQQPQIINAGASQREIDLMEREAKLRERMAEMEGFMMGQQAATKQQDSLAALLSAAEDED